MVKLSDVAKKSGVGAGTVSRVLNNSGPVSEKTREKVMSVINELGYVPNETARMFKSQDPKIVAIFVPSIWHPFYSKLAFYVEAELDRYGYKTMMCSSSHLPSKEIEYLSMLKQNKISGAVCISYNDIERHIDNKNNNIVFIDRIFKKNVTYVTSNNYQGGLLAAEHISNCGYNAAAYFGTYNQKINTEIKYRQSGFQNGLKKYGIKYIPHLRQDPITNLPLMVDELFRRREKEHFHAVFAENDLLAAEIYAKATSLGIKVPDELAIIGYDGIQDNTLFKPILTTIAQPVEKMGSLCVQLIIKKIKNEAVEKRNVVDVVLLKGETTVNSDNSFFVPPTLFN